MIRHHADVKTRVCVLILLVAGGCQRATGPASGPFAPAGTYNPSAPPTLIPFGNFNEATRVPPPSTGSSQVSNGYAAPPSIGSVSMSDGNPAAAPTPGTWFASDLSGNPTPAAIGSGLNPAPVATTRPLLGGMPVNDLTVAMRDPRLTPNAPLVGLPTAPAAFSSDPRETAGNWQTVQPAGGFQPLDAGPGAVVPVTNMTAGMPSLQPVPQSASYPGDASQSVERSFIPAQPVPAQALPNQAFPSQPVPAETMSEPVPMMATPTQTTAPAANSSLLWRKPAVSR